MKTVYFLKTKKDSKGVLRVYPLKGQSTLLSTLRVSCSIEERNKWPEGSIFFTYSVTDKKTHYLASSITKLDLVTESEELTSYRELVKELRGTSTKETSTKPERVDVVVELPETLKISIGKDSKLIRPNSKKDGFYMSSEDWEILVRNIKRKVNTMILGPTGSGKTSCVKEVCDRMGIELHVFDMGSMIDPVSSLLGVHRLEEGKSIFDMAKFTQVIQKPCVILLDELNRSSIGSNNILFPCLDHRRELNIEIAGSKDVRTIKIHPEVTFIATANIGAEYTGTSTIDRALMNRFFPLELGYIPNTEEELVLMNRFNISKEMSKSIVKIANNIRSLAKKGELSISISIRETLMVASLVSDGWDLGKSMEIAFLPLFEGTKTSGERSTVQKTISSY